MVVGPAQPRPRVGVRRRLRRRLGGFGGRVLVPVLGDGGEAPSHRLPRARRALRAGLLAARRQRAELPPVLHHHHAGRRARRGAGGLRRVACARSGGGSPRGSSTGCGSTTPTACATPRRTSTTWPASPAARTCWSRRSSSPARRCRRPGRRPARPGTTRSASSTACSSTLPAEAPLDASRPAARWPRPWADLTHDTKRGGGRRVAAGRGTPDRPRAPGPPWSRKDAACHETRELEDAVAEVLANFPVYRSYLPDGVEHLDAGARRRARRTAPTCAETSTGSRRC